MNSSLPAPLTAAWGVLTTLVLGLGLGIATRKALAVPARRRFAAVINGLALNLFLPFFVIDSLLANQPSAELGLAFAAGFALPALTFGALWLYAKQYSEKHGSGTSHAEVRFLASTFGGGSRGTALLLLLFAARPNFSDYLKWFTIVDLGNFACLLTLISYLMQRHYGQPSADSRPWWRALLGNYAVVALAIAIAYFAVRARFPAIDGLLAGTVHQRKVLFSLFVFWAIALQFNLARTGGLFGDALVLLAGRAAAALVIFGVAAVFFSPPSQFYAATSVLLLMPPSSVAPAMIASAGAPPTSVEYVNSFAGGANIFYLFLLALGCVILLT